MGPWHRLIRQSLAATQDAAGDHPPAERLAAFARRRGWRRERRRIAAHLNRCPACRAAVLAATEPATIASRVPQFAAAAAAVLVLGVVFAARGVWTPAPFPPAPGPASAVTPQLTPAQTARPPAAMEAHGISPRSERAAARRANRRSAHAHPAAANARMAAPAPSIGAPSNAVTVAATGFLDQPRLQRSFALRSASAARRAAHLGARPQGIASPALETSLVAHRQTTASQFTLRIPLLGNVASTSPARTPSSLAADAFAAGGAAVWRVSARGALEASLDGKAWSAWQTPPAPSLRAVTAVGSRVWAAGRDATIFFSADSGAHWSRLAQIPAASRGAPVVRSIEFDDAMHGSLLTASGRSWTTADGGLTWQPANN